MAAVNHLGGTLLRRAWLALAVLLAGLLAAGTGQGTGTGGSVLDQVGSGQSSAAAAGEEVVESIELLAPTTATGDAETLRLGLAVDLAEGWKTYWRHPGAAGLPPRLDWSDSQNLAEAELAYPAPERFSLFGLETYGYGKRVVFPITVTLDAPGAPLRARADVELLVCADVCVPFETSVAADLPAGEAEASEHAQTIDRWRGRVPVSGEVAGLAVDRLVAGTHAGRPAAAVTVSSDTAFEDPDAIVSPLPSGGFQAPRLRVSDDGHKLEALFVGDQMAPEDLELAGRELSVTVLDGARTAAMTADAEADQARIADLAAALPAAGNSTGGGSSGGDGGSGAGGSGPAVSGAAGVALMLGAAVLGGLILNVMPCVLPVLSLKVLSVVGSGGQAPGRVRANFLITAAGILAAFLVLAGGLIVVKLAGESVGWGVQFQQPVFLAFMILVLGAFAANLLGLFEIALPQRLAGALSGTADRAGDSAAGHFLSGAFATLLATPCSAPFLGTAVSFALSRGPAEIAAIFAFLGLGLALPYLAVAAWPRAATALPRPGRWMVHVKRVLALALIATAVWLLSVLAQQTSAAIAVIVAAAVLAAAGSPVLGRRRYPLARPLAGGAALAAVLLALLAPVLGPTGQSAASAQAAPAEGHWQRFSESAIDAAVAEGKVVFVDITADWCITCKANKRLVLSEPPVADRLASADIRALRGDWTSPDPAIDSYLSAHGRYGVPFNAVYGPDAPDGIVLPEILSEKAVTEALAEAQ